MKSRTVKLITAAAFLIPALLYIASFLISVYAGSLPIPEGPFDTNRPPPEWYSYLKSLEIQDIATVVLHVSEAAAAASVMALGYMCFKSLISVKSYVFMPFGLALMCLVMSHIMDKTQFAGRGGAYSFGYFTVYRTISFVFAACMLALISTKERGETKPFYKNPLIGLLVLCMIPSLIKAARLSPFSGIPLLPMVWVMLEMLYLRPWLMVFAAAAFKGSKGYAWVPPSLVLCVLSYLSDRAMFGFDLQSSYGLQSLIVPIVLCALAVYAVSAKPSEGRGFYKRPLIWVLSVCLLLIPDIFVGACLAFMLFIAAVCRKSLPAGPAAAVAAICLGFRLWQDPAMHTIVLHYAEGAYISEKIIILLAFIQMFLYYREACKPKSAEG